MTVTSVAIIESLSNNDFNSGRNWNSIYQACKIAYLMRHRLISFLLKVPKSFAAASLISNLC